MIEPCVRRDVQQRDLTTRGFEMLCMYLRVNELSARVACAKKKTETCFDILFPVRRGLTFYQYFRTQINLKKDEGLTSFFVESRDLFVAFKQSTLQHVANSFSRSEVILLLVNSTQ